MTLKEFEATVGRIMAEVTTMTLATCAGGIPWATDVYFAPDGFDLVFFSSPDSRHSQNLAVNPVGAVTIHPPAASWRDIRGLQMEGAGAKVAAVAGKVRAGTVYFRKFPFAQALMANPQEVAGSLAKVTAHVFRPSYLRLIDNAMGFGARYAVRLQDGAAVGPPERE
jgi:uncharacterized protein